MKTKIKTDLDSQTIISFSIDGDWETNDFIDFMKAVEYLYAYFLSHELTVNDIKNISKIANTEKHRESLRYSMTRAHFQSAYFHSDHNIFNPMNGRFGPFSNRVGRVIIKKMQYSSPGSIDFLGIGKVLSTLKEIITYYIPNKHQKEKVKLLKQKRIKIEIENLKAIGLDDIEIQALVLRREISLEKIQHLNHFKKINDIELN